jgi:hypothetical protein
MQTCRCADVQMCSHAEDAEEMQSTISAPEKPQSPQSPMGRRAIVCISASCCSLGVPQSSLGHPFSRFLVRLRNHDAPRLMRRPEGAVVNGRRCNQVNTVAPACLLSSPPTPFSCFAATASCASPGTEPSQASPSQASPLSAARCLPACPPVRLSACRSKRAWAVKANTAATVPPQPLAGLLIHASCLRVPSVDPYDTLDQFNPFNPFNPAACTHACTLLTTHPLTHSPINPLTPSPPTHHPLTLPPIPHPCHSCHSCRRPSAACRFAPFWPLSHLDHSQPSPPPTLHLLRLLRRRF